MELLISGIKYGLALSILVGPIIFALIQTSIERGFRAGFAVALGIWTSDFLFICAVFFGMSYITSMTASDNFILILGIVGGIALIILGLGTLLSKPPSIPQENTQAETLIDKQLPSFLDFDDNGDKNRPGYLSLWLKGLLINTLNPFSMLFWMGITTTVVVQNDLSSNNAWIFYSSILGTLIVTDTLKIQLAKSVRKILTPRNILNMRRISGAALFIFGVILILRVIVL